MIDPSDTIEQFECNMNLRRLKDLDGSKTLMNLKASHYCENDDVNIGDEWSYDLEINGERPTNTIGVSAGDTLSFSDQITESDDNPDVGTGSTSHTITEEDIENGFEALFSFAGAGYLKKIET